MSKIVKLEGFLFGPPNIFGSTTKEIISSENSIKNLFGQELKNKSPKEIDSKLFLDTRLNIIGKNIKEGISSINSSGITLTNNEIKDIIKVIKSLENKGVLLKATTAKLLVKKEYF